jgi:hypothetical protein
VAAFADQYKGIVDTFVQLSPPRSAGLIVHVQCADLAPQVTGEMLHVDRAGHSRCWQHCERRKAGAEAMCYQPGTNATRGLPLAAGDEGLCDGLWLVAKAKSGHEDAFGELYKRHRLKAHRTALRILRNQQDAEDAV